MGIISGIVSDSASNMRKVASILKLPHQRCIIHMVHNTLQAYLEKKKEKED